MKDTLMRLKTAILAAVVCTAGPSAFAQLIITQSPTAPTTGIYKHTTTESTNNVTAYKRMEGNPLDRQIGQGFSTVGETEELVLNSVTFKLQRYDAEIPEGALVGISVYKGAGVATNPASSVLLSKQMGNLPLGGLTVNNYVTFSLAEPVTLAADGYFSVIFSFEEYTSLGSAATAIGFYTIGSGVFNSDLGLNARRWIADDATWTGSNQNGFVTYVGASSVIPEPSTYALAGGAIALLAVAVARKRSRK